MLKVASQTSIAVSDEADLVVTHTDDARGLGVRILTPAEKGSILHRFTGRITAEPTQHSLQVAPGQHIVDTPIIGYLLHGCAPNARLDMAGRTLIALRDIAAGEWVTIDYSETEDHLYCQFACSCGAAQCRGWITGRLEQAKSAPASIPAIRQVP